MISFVCGLQSGLVILATSADDKKCTLTAQVSRTLAGASAETYEAKLDMAVDEAKAMRSVLSKFIKASEPVTANTTG